MLFIYMLADQAKRYSIFIPALLFSHFVYNRSYFGTWDNMQNYYIDSVWLESVQFSFRITLEGKEET